MIVHRHISLATQTALISTGLSWDGVKSGLPMCLEGRRGFHRDADVLIGWGSILPLAISGSGNALFSTIAQAAGPR